MAQNLVYHACTKHIDVRYHRIREPVEEDEVEQMKVYTKENQSDALMKVLFRDSFQIYVARMDLLKRDEFTRTWKHQVENVSLKVVLPSYGNMRR